MAPLDPTLPPALERSVVLKVAFDQWLLLLVQLVATPRPVPNTDRTLFNDLLYITEWLELLGVNAR